MDEAGELVAGEEGLLQRRVARQAEVRAVREHRLDHLLRPALLAQDRRAVLRMLVERRVDLVVEVVEQCGRPPELLVLAELRRVGAHRGLHRKRVTQQRLALRVAVERLPGLLTSRLPRRATIAPRRGPDCRHRRARRVLRDRGWPAPERPCSRRREQERRPAGARRLPAHERAGRAQQRAADPRRRDDDRADRGTRRGRRVDRRERGEDPRRGRLLARARRRAVEPHPRIVPARRPVARAPRPGERPASGRRRDRAAPARPAHPRARGAGRRDRHRRALRAAHGRPAREAHLPRRGERDGDREHGHGRRA